MRIPTLTEANRILEEAEKRNPGPWGDHSRTVALCAGKIAENCGDMDVEAACILGLLHDIGRRFGIGHFRHIADGYHYMKELGYEDAARICITHSYQYQNINAYSGNLDVTEEEYKEIEDQLDAYTYHDYDRLIQLCDCLAKDRKVMLIEQRLVDVVLRYGFTQYTTQKWKAIFDLKKYFEEKMSKNLYEAVSDDQSLWGK